MFINLVFISCLKLSVTSYCYFCTAVCKINSYHLHVACYLRRMRKITTKQKMCTEINKPNFVFFKCFMV